ncbi:ribosomal protein L14 [Rhizophagus irregularis DAOM 181602=DAOM 197198]|nr:ribosomal protein L14 [Rhizophagus irregularis DAOM 181602=DAOM 197198]
MIQLKTLLNVIDNTGAIIAECIRVGHDTYSNSYLPFLLTLGDPITVVIKKAKPISQVASTVATSPSAASNPAAKLQIRRGEVKKALIVRTRKETRRLDVLLISIKC